MPVYLFLGKGSPTQIDYRKKGTLVLAALLEDLGKDMLHGFTELWFYQGILCACNEVCLAVSMLQRVKARSAGLWCVTLAQTLWGSRPVPSFVFLIVFHAD